MKKAPKGKKKKTRKPIKIRIEEYKESNKDKERKQKR